MRDNTLGLLDDIETNERNLHGENGAENIEGGVGDVETVGVTT